MDDRALRAVLRYTHLTAALVILVLVYTPWHDNSALLWITRIGIFPFLLLGGLAMWKQSPLSRRLGWTSAPARSDTR
jgi:hypothetical protein